METTVDSAPRERSARSRKLRRRVAISLSAAGLIAGSVLIASPAQAVPVKVSYQVPLWSVCWDQGHNGVFTGNPFNRWAWYCYDQPRPWWPMGGLNIQAWCDRHYPGSRAEFDTAQPPIAGWRCIRIENRNI